jgi:hypothetical protein
VLRIGRVVQDHERAAKPVVRWVTAHRGLVPHDLLASGDELDDRVRAGHVPLEVRVILADVGDLDDDPAGLHSGRDEASTIQQRLHADTHHHRADQDQHD